MLHIMELLVRQDWCSGTWICNALICSPDQLDDVKYICGPMNKWSWSASVTFKWIHWWWEHLNCFWFTIMTLYCLAMVLKVCNCYWRRESYCFLEKPFCWGSVLIFDFQVWTVSPNPCLFFIFKGSNIKCHLFRIFLSAVFFSTCNKEAVWGYWK